MDVLAGRGTIGFGRENAEQLGGRVAPRTGHRLVAVFGDLAAPFAHHTPALDQARSAASRRRSPGLRHTRDRMQEECLPAPVPGWVGTAFGGRVPRRPPHCWSPEPPHSSPHRVDASLTETATLTGTMARLGSQQDVRLWCNGGHIGARSRGTSASFARHRGRGTNRWTPALTST